MDQVSSLGSCEVEFFFLSGTNGVACQSVLCWTKGRVQANLLCEMRECWSRVTEGEMPIVDGSEATPTKCRGPWGVVYAVFGNINFNIVLAASILYVVS